jgi:5-methyltetrahydrofolate--homocysteine methyltransferase
VGGAALSEKFTRTKIAPAYSEAVCYAKDAMTGLALMNRLMDPAQRAELLASATTVEAPAAADVPPEPLGPLTTRRSSKVRTDLPVPAVPGTGATCRICRRVGRINPFMIYGHLGTKAISGTRGHEGRRWAVPQRRRGQAGSREVHA